MAINIIRSAVRATGGTQASEYAAAIKSVTSATTVGAVFIYDTSQDSDGGAWRKKCKGLSWFDEASSATRSARSEFPAMALIVADNAATPTVTIYDLDDPAMPMWMVFSSEASGDSNHFWRYGDATSIAALNGRIIVGKTTAGGSTEIRLVEDKTWNNGSSGTNQMLGGIVDRNSGLGWGTVDASRTTVNNQHNDVAMTVLEGAEIGALGLPEVTIAVATTGGISVIHSNGSVYDIATDATVAAAEKIAFNDSGDISSVWGTIGSGTRYAYIHKVPYADEGADDNPVCVLGDITTSTNVDLNYWAGTPSRDGVVAMGNDEARGFGDGLFLHKRNTGNPAEGAVAYITSAYNTGYMVGDIRGAFLAGNGTGNEEREDRSVKGNDLTETGTIDSAVVATGAELYGYSGFTTDDYLWKDYHSSLDLGTTCTVMAWVKVVAGSTLQTVASFNDTSISQGWQLLMTAAEQPYFYVYGSSADGGSGNAAAITDTGWHFLVGINDGARNYIYVDGNLSNSTAAVHGSMNNSGADLTVGIYANKISFPLLGSLSLLRVSATASTPQQIKEIYEAEKPLFAAGAKCLLQSDSGGAPNGINDLSYDKTTGLLHTYQGGTNTAETRFRGLEAVDSYGGKSNGWSASGATGGVVAGGVKASYRAATAGGVILDLPAIDVRAELNEDATKLPDDGKLHFSGVTTSNGGDTIGYIPVAEGEQVTVYADITATGYSDSTIYASYRYVRQFYRDAGGDITGTANTSISTIESASALNGYLGASASVNAALIQVTGDATARMKWTATVEVIRHTEKNYER